MNVKYREIEEKDAYGFEFVAAHSWKDTYWNLLPQERLIKRIERLSKTEELEKKIKDTKEYIKSNPKKIYVAELNDQIVGILAIDTKEECGYLEAIYVLPEYKGKGIGKELLFLAIKKFIELGYNKLTLECMRGNSTIDFYKKYGGSIIDTNKQIIYDKEVEVDTVLFENIKEILLEETNNNIKK